MRALTAGIADNVHDQLLWEPFTTNTVSMDETPPPLLFLAIVSVICALAALMFMGGQYGKRQELLKEYATSTTALHW